MSFELPGDRRERTRIMVSLARGETVEYEVDGKRYKVSPQKFLDSTPALKSPTSLVVLVLIWFVIFMLLVAFVVLGVGYEM